MLIGGIDEVGRGSLAGPIMAAIAIFDYDQSECPVPGVQDSKMFGSDGRARDRRVEVYRQLLGCRELLDVGLGEVSHAEIDEKGINWANQRVFELAVGSLNQRPDSIIVDGELSIPNYPLERQYIMPKADRDRWQVGAASIIAKVIRDRLMTDYGLVHPEYHWCSNAGYGSPKHIDAIRQYGLTPLHRRSFTEKALKGKKEKKALPTFR